MTVGFFLKIRWEKFKIIECEIRGFTVQSTFVVIVDKSVSSRVVSIIYRLLAPIVWHKSK